jgi:hypothetical protein
MKKNFIVYKVADESLNITETNVMIRKLQSYYTNRLSERCRTKPNPEFYFSMAIVISK